MPLSTLVLVSVLLCEKRLLAWLGLRRGEPAPGPSSAEELIHRADAALIALDDAVRLREHDLDAARRTFGKAEVEPLARALQGARTVLVEAFGLRREVDDRPPADRRARLNGIVTHCSAAGRRLEAALTGVDRLYELEQNIAVALADLRARVDGAMARLPTVAATLNGLRTRYSPFALAAVTDNVTSADAALGDACAAVNSGYEAVAAGRAAAAAVALRSGEQAADRVVALLDGVDRLAAELFDAGVRYVEAEAEVRADLAEAHALNPDGRAAELGVAAGRARAALKSAGPDVGEGGGDPLTALRRLDEAGQALEHALVAVRATRAEGRRLAPQLDRAVLTARSGIAAADDLVALWRGVIGGPARARLVEARRLVKTAEELALSDPPTAVESARQADALAQEAIRLAGDDVERWVPPADEEDDPVGATGYDANGNPVRRRSGRDVDEATGTTTPRAPRRKTRVRRRRRPSGA